MTLYNKRKFTVPATTPTKRPCKVHHMVKGKCLRCDHAIKAVRIPDGGILVSLDALTDGSEGEE